MIINIYCDESCHLEHDRNNIMVIGGVWIEKEKRQEICERIKKIKELNSIPRNYELKWSNISKLKRRAYIDLLNMFFDDDDLHFRGIIVQNKNELDFSKFDGDYDTWYYKIYYLMISQILSRDNCYNIYLDIKDTKSSEKLHTLKNVIENNTGNIEIINNMQVIRSEEVEIMQLTDILIGALSYRSRDLSSSSTKNELLDLIIERSKFTFNKSSLLRDDKFNVFYWRPQNG